MGSTVAKEEPTHPRTWGDCDGADEWWSAGV